MTTIRALLTATLVVAAGPIAAAAPPAKVVSEDVPVPGGTAALARAIGIEPAPDRARFVSELARLIYAESREKRQSADSMGRRLNAYVEWAEQARPLQLDRAEQARSLQPPSQETVQAADLVPMPLSSAVWSQAVFHRPVAPAGLFAAVMSDRAAALLARGLAALDDETLQFFADRPAVVARLYAHGAPVFAAFAEHLHIRDNRVVPPGGDRALPLWEAVLNERVAQPDRFVRQLFTKDKGRIAYLYDIVGGLDASRAAFALGLWIDDPGVRVDRFKALAAVAASACRSWRVDLFPFGRPPQDLQSMLSRVQAGGTGAPGFPASRALWAAAFDGSASRDDVPKSLEDDARIDAAWLAEATVVEVRTLRIERLDQLAFGHRAFAGANSAALPDVVAALQAFPRFPMLMLTLERIGVGRPAVFAAMAQQAQRLSLLDAARGHTALAQFQGAIALIARLASVHAIDRATAEALLTTLGAVPFNQDRRYSSAFAQWLQSQLLAALAAEDDLEGALLGALAGAAVTTPPTLVSWEGQHYRFDLVTAEAQRLGKVRERQGGYSIDAAMSLHAMAQMLAAFPDVHAAIAASLFELVDVVLGEAMLSLSYAADLGNPEGPARFAAALARRHDFGFDGKDHETRVRTAWAQPKQVFKEGVPWHVKGAVLGLPVAFAPLALRRIHADPLKSAPTLSITERDAFATSLALMNPFELRDSDRDAIAEAVARGQRRVEAIAGGDGDANALAHEIAMDGWRRRALRWTIAHDPARARSLFSMTDLLYLGGGRGVDLNPWGMSALTSQGCMCTQLAAPGLWTALVGRPQLGLIAATVADLNLRVAVMLHELQLPAALARSVLAAAVQDFVDRVRPSDADDWLTLVRTAQDVSRERIEDFVAAATAGGPLVPETITTSVRVR